MLVNQYSSNMFRDSHFNLIDKQDQQFASDNPHNDNSQIEHLWKSVPRKQKECYDQRQRLGKFNNRINLLSPL